MNQKIEIDDGETSFRYEERVSRAHPYNLVNVQLDEVTAMVGHMSWSIPELREDWLEIGTALGLIMGEVAVSQSNRKRFEDNIRDKTVSVLGAVDLELLNGNIEMWRKATKHLPQNWVRGFESIKSGCANILRAKLRSVDATIVEKLRGEWDRVPLLRTYINRLSDYLFLVSLWYSKNDVPPRLS